MVRMVEHGFAPVGSVEHAGDPGAAHPRLPRARQLRVHGQPSRRAVSTRALLDEPAPFDYMRLAHPPVTFRHEKLKGDERIPAARRYIVEHGLNELFRARATTSASSCRAACTTRSSRALQQLGLADAFGDRDAADARAQRRPIRWCPSRSRDFCAGKRAVLVVEEGQPEYIEQEIAAMLRRRDIADAAARQGPAARRPASTRSR